VRLFSKGMLEYNNGAILVILNQRGLVTVATLEVSSQLLEELEKLAAEEGLKVSTLAETVLTDFVSMKLAENGHADEDEPNLDPDELEASYIQAKADLAAGKFVTHEQIKAMAVEILGTNLFKKG
jgi:predicted transcriptional regulator